MWPTSSTNRSGILKLGATGTDLTTSVSIVQEGRFFDDIAALLTFSAAAGTNSIDITTDGKWAAKISDDASSWLTISPTTGTGSGTLQVSVTENTDDDERTASVDVTVGTTTKTVGIVQRGKFFTVSPSTFATLASTGGSHAIHIASDDSWTAQSSSTWMTLSRASGTGNVDVTLTAPDYPSIKARDDTTTFTPVYAQPVRVITRQLGRYLTVDVISIRFFGKGGTSNAVQISTDGTFNISASDNWFSVERQGNTFTVIATEITTDTQREGKVIITMTGLLPGEEYVLEVPVIQRPKSSGLDVWTFDDDQQWELNGDGTFAIRVTGFSADKNWNDTSSEGLTIKVTTFSEDKLWDY